MKYKCNKCHELLEEKEIQSPRLDHHDLYHFRTEWICAPFGQIGARCITIICGPVDIALPKDLNEEDELDKWETCLGTKL